MSSLTDNIIPPAPPTIEEMGFVLGQFEYISDSSSRKMLQNAYQAINLTETWDFVKQDIYSFMVCDAPEIKIILEKMGELGYHGHSGVSFGFIMREMQFIAQKGEKEYKKLTEKNN